VNERCEERIEQSSRGHADTDRVHNQSAVEVLEDDGPASMSDTNVSTNLLKIVPKQGHTALSRATSVPLPMATPTVVRSAPVHH